MLGHGIEPIDLLVVNLYPFEDDRRQRRGVRRMLENIDIGGPAMIRAAAKNYADVAVITDLGDYARLLAELRTMAAPRGSRFRRAGAEGLCPHRRL